jgi:glycosyltransferase involved in cell wall biosynthesis
MVSLEHIIQDGGSTDGTAKWMTDFLAERQSDPLYQLSFASEQDKGMYDAINKGWSRASGEILSWLNCDEQYLPGTLARVQWIFERRPDVDMIYGNAIIIDASGAPVSARREIPLDKRLITNTFLNVFSCTCFFRRRLWDQGFLALDAQYRYAADLELILRLLDQGVRTHFVDEYLSLFQADGNNLSTQSGMRRETELIQKRHGAGSSWFRRTMRVVRWCRRLWHGCYFPQKISYDFALDEVPTYMHREGVCGGVFRFK